MIERICKLCITGEKSVVCDGKETTQEIEKADEIEEAGPSEVNTTGELDVTNDNAFA